MSDIDQLQAAFEAAAAWIKGGTITSTQGGAPFQWRHGSWSFFCISTSPAGPYSAIKGPKFTAYLRPDATRNSGHMGRIDLRDSTTPEALLALPATLLAEPFDVLHAANNEHRAAVRREFPMEQIGDAVRIIQLLERENFRDAADFLRRIYRPAFPGDEAAKGCA